MKLNEIALEMEQIARKLEGAKPNELKEMKRRLDELARSVRGLYEMSDDSRGGLGGLSTW